MILRRHWVALVGCNFMTAAFAAVFAGVWDGLSWSGGSVECGVRLEGRFRWDWKIVQALHLRLRGMGKASPAGVCHLSPKVLMLDWPS